MSKETYILKNNVHFGTLKFSVNKGAKIIIDRDINKVYIRDKEYENVSEIDMCIRKGFIIPFVEGETDIDSTIKISPKAQNKKKYEVEKSDVDSMNESIEISDFKKEEQPVKESKMQVIRENESEEDSRGLKVITNDAVQGVEVDNKNIMQVINADDGEIVAKIPPKTSKPKGVPEKTQAVAVTSTSAEDLAAINGEQGTVVKTIGKSANTKEVSSGKKLTTKKASKSSADQAKANAEARKKASEARRAKAKENA